MRRAHSSTSRLGPRTTNGSQGSFLCNFKWLSETRNKAELQPTGAKDHHSLGTLSDSVRPGTRRKSRATCLGKWTPSLSKGNYRHQSSKTWINTFNKNSSDWILSIRPNSMAIVLPKLYQRSWTVIHISINQLCKRFQPTSMVNTSITTMQTSHLSPKMHSVSETVISHWLKGFLSNYHWLLFPLQPCIALFIMPETNLFLTSRQELVYFNAQKTKRHEDPN